MASPMPFGIYQLVTFVYQSVQRVGLVTSGNYHSGWDDMHCFPTSTLISISLTETRPISDIWLDDKVLSFDRAAKIGRGALVARRVTRHYRNTTTEWIRLRWVDGTAREVITTPGHHFLDEFGGFPTIEEMARTGYATVVLASGAVMQVTAELINFCAHTAHLFGRAMGQGVVVGNRAEIPNYCETVCFED